MTPEHRLALAFVTSHPRRAAEVLERLTPDATAALVRQLPAADAAPVIREMASRQAAACLATLAAERAAAIVEHLVADRAAALLRRLAPEACDAVLRHLAPARRDTIARVLRYPAGTAGAVMDPAIFALPDDITVEDARDRLRGATRDLLYYVYVVDRSHRLVGVLDIPELMLARADQPLRAVMHAHVDRLSAWAPPAVIRAHGGWRSFHALPVVDEEDRFVGAIRYQTLRRIEHDASGASRSPGAQTALALGELYHLGVTGLLGSLGAAAPARRESASDEAAAVTDGAEASSHA